MTRLQEDIISIYNSLTDFSSLTLMNEVPIHVYYDFSLNSVCFEQRGKKISLPTLNYYCKYLKRLDTYLLPSDYDILMSSMATLIGSGILIHDRVLVEPDKWGFSVYETDTRSVKDGPQLYMSLRFAVNNSRIIKTIINYFYKNKL